MALTRRQMLMYSYMYMYARNQWRLGIGCSCRVYYCGNDVVKRRALGTSHSTADSRQQRHTEDE